MYAGLRFNVWVRSTRMSNYLKHLHKISREAEQKRRAQKRNRNSIHIETISLRSIVGITPQNPKRTSNHTQSNLFGSIRLSPCDSKYLDETFYQYQFWRQSQNQIEKGARTNNISAPADFQSDVNMYDLEKINSSSMDEKTRCIKHCPSLNKLALNGSIYIEPKWVETGDWIDELCAIINKPVYYFSRDNCVDNTTPLELEPISCLASVDSYASLHKASLHFDVQYKICWPQCLDPTNTEIKQDNFEQYDVHDVTCSEQHTIESVDFDRCRKWVVASMSNPIYHPHLFSLYLKYDSKLVHFSHSFTKKK